MKQASIVEIQMPEHRRMAFHVGSQKKREVSTGA
jgi:hypothetical protein